MVAAALDGFRWCSTVFNGDGDGLRQGDYDSKMAGTMRGREGGAMRGTMQQPAGAAMRGQVGGEAMRGQVGGATRG